MVTSALPYIQGMPHLGNFVGSILPADVYARFLRLTGKNVIFICGSDEHGSPLEIAAFKKGVKPEILATENHKKVLKYLQLFNCDFDHYGRTSHKLNKETVLEIFSNLNKNKLIKEGKLNQAFCAKCSRFLPDRWVEGKCPRCSGLGRGDQCDECGALLKAEELVDPYCVICRCNIIFKESKHLFLDLPKVSSKIAQWIEKNIHWPENARKLTLTFIKKGLEQRCITRDMKWGFKVPLEGFDNKVFYVWFDAPIGYIGCTKEWAEKIGKPKEWQKWWHNKDTKLIQFMGKDNILFHTIIWPALLIGSKLGYILPYWIVSYEYLVAKGIKFSKSRKVGLNIETALEIRSADHWRYVLMSLLPENRDVEFTLELFAKKVDELADCIGNFVHRVLSLIIKYFDGNIPEKYELDEIDEKLINEFIATSQQIKVDYEKIKLKKALNQIVKLAKIGNVYLNTRSPWHTIKTDKKRTATTLYISANIVKNLAIMLFPYIPHSSQKIWDFLNLGKISEVRWTNIAFDLKSGLKINRPQPLFKKISSKELAYLKSKFQFKRDEEKYVDLQEFTKYHIEVGTIISAEKVKDSTSLLKLKINFSSERTIVAKIGKYYTCEELIGKQVIGILNIKQRVIKNILSEGTLLVAKKGSRLSLITPDRKIAPGAKIV